MGDVLLVLAISAATLWLAITLYFGYEAEVDAMTHHSRPLERRPRAHRGRHHFA